MSEGLQQCLVAKHKQVRTVVSSKKIDDLYEKALDLSPYLKGERLSNVSNTRGLLYIGQDCSRQIKQLYDGLSEANPEAGNGYYLSRTWELLSWQPLYLSFVAIYQMQAVPDMRSIVQKFQPSSVYGFHFTNELMFSDQVQSLIEQVSNDLMSLFEGYRRQIGELVRIRPGFTNYLLADSILKLVTIFQPIRTDISIDEWQQQAQSWLKHTCLPITLLDNLQITDETNQLNYVRTSCCQVYRCKGGALCADCPRAVSKKRKS